MKTHILKFAAILIVTLVSQSIITSSFAQAPEMFNYQAVVRDNAGNILSNQAVSFRLSILQGSMYGASVYVETQKDTTNSYGISVLKIGAGNPQYGSMTGINWTNGSYFIKVELDQSGGTAYTTMGVTQLISVPYALHSKTADSVSGTYPETDPVFGVSVAGSITAADTANWNDKLDLEVDGSVTNELQVLSIAHDTIYLSNGGYVNIASYRDTLWNKSGNNIFNTNSGNVGIGTASPAALLHIHHTATGNGNVLFTGEYKSSNPGPAPATGPGTRMMWYPDKAAFRAGNVDWAYWDTDSIGKISVGLGCNTKAKGYSSTAMGYYTTASGNYSTAMGFMTNASKPGSTAMGDNTAASGNNSTAMGDNTAASGHYSTAMGSNTTASGNNSTAMGLNTSASGYSSTAMGYYSTASGYYSTALGYYSTASGTVSTAIGYGSTASGNYSTAMGYETTAPSCYETVIGLLNTDYAPLNTTGWNAADRLFVIGNGTGSTAKSDAMVVLKNGNTGFGTSTPTALLHASGTATGGGNVLFAGSYKSSSPGAAPATGAGTRMMWYPDKAAFRAGYVDGAYWDTDSIGKISVGLGYNTRAKGYASTAMGYVSTASGNYSTASGYFCQALGNYSVAMGHLAKARGEGSTAFGSSSMASGINATALGYASNASGDFSFAVGYNPTALGDYSVALGWMAYANNLAGNAIGYGTTTFGQYATALGYYCTASGSTSVAIGNNTATTGNYSIAMGSYTTTPSAYEMVVGRYNTSYSPGSSITWNSNDRLFVIGNGTSSSSLSNAMTVMKNGKVGIGTDAPGEILHVRNTSGTARIRIAAADSTLAEMNFFQDAIYKGAIGFDNTSENIYIYQAGNVNIKNGRIGIQTVNNPTYAVELPNSAIIGTGSGRAYAWTTYSDNRIKSDVKEINYGIDAVLKLKPVSYLQHNSTAENGKIVIDNAGVYNIGFIAQDIYKIIPEIVNKPENEENTLWSMSYEKLTPVLVKAIQEQQAIIESQKSTIGKLEAQNSEILKRLEMLEQSYGLVKK